MKSDKLKEELIAVFEKHGVHMHSLSISNKKVAIETSDVGREKHHRFIVANEIIIEAYSYHKTKWMKSK